MPSIRDRRSQTAMLDIRLLFVALVWGVNFSAVKFALGRFDPLGFTVVRFALASLFLFAVMKATGRPFGIERRHRVPVAMLGFVGITMYNLFFMYGLKYTSAANSALLISLSPLFGALIQAATGKERLTRRIGAGLGLAAVGVFLIIQSSRGSAHFTPASMGGDLLTLAAALTWSLYTIQAKPLLEHYSPLAVTAFAMAAGSVLLLPLGLPGLYRQSWGDIPALAWSALLFAAFIAAGVAYVFWYRGVKYHGVTRTMVYHYIMPLAAVLFAAFALGEKIAPLQSAGGVSVLAGVYLVQSRTGRKE